MLKFFEEDSNGLVVPSLEIKTIDVFKKIVSRDRGSTGDHDGRKKFKAIKELAYVYWSSTIGSPYNTNYSDDKERMDAIKKEVGLSEKWKPDAVVQAACDKYKELQTTKLTLFLESVETGLDNLSSYIKDADLTKEIESGSRKGELVHDVNKIRAIVEKMPAMIESYNNMVNKVKKEQEQLTGRGGVTINSFEQRPT